MPRFRAAFLDRDGTLNVEIQYLHRVQDFEWIPGAVESVRRLNEAGVLVLVVTNQAGIAHGKYTERDVHTLHDHMRRELEEHGAHVDRFYFCPFHPEGVIPEYRRASRCRKPNAGMLEQGMSDWELGPDECVMVGDKNSDVEAGLSLGVQTVLVETGYGAEHSKTTRANRVVADIVAATDLILSP